MKRTGGFRPSDNAAMILAASLTFLGGLAACVFISVSSSPDPRKAIAVAVCAFVGVILLLWLARDRHPDDLRDTLWSRLFDRPRTRKVTVQVRRNKSASLDLQEPAGPPSAERIRELKAHASTWVPAGGHRGGSVGGQQGGNSPRIPGETGR